MQRNRLFIKLSGLFLVILLVTGLISTYITTFTAIHYFQEANQRLNAKLAQYTVDHLPNTFLPDGKIDTNSIQDLMHSMMVINPDVEVYLIDANGKILTDVAPDKVVVRHQVNMDPIRRFIATDGKSYILGDDPRDQLGSKVFSAAPILQDGHLKGYYYIILASQEQAGVFSMLREAYALKLGSKLLLFTLLGSLLIGIVVFWYQTKQLRHISGVMADFQEGDYQARIAEDKSPDFGILRNTFNDMASKIQAYIQKIISIDSFRKELIANISHDLRTPLSIIQGYTETMMMKHGQLPEETAVTYIENIHESSKRLTGLVNQLFELSKLESNQIELHKEPFAVDELVKDMMHRYEILASKKSITLKFNNRKKIPLVLGDIALVERVIQNILDNAMKFTPQGGIIEVSITHDDKHVKIQISDNGEGISESEQSAIFDRYIKSAGALKQSAGSGLGLAIARKIIELHDSTIQVKSKLHAGSTFSFQLPALHAKPVMP